MWSWNSLLFFSNFPFLVSVYVVFWGSDLVEEILLDFSAINLFPYFSHEMKASWERVNKHWNKQYECTISFWQGPRAIVHWFACACIFLQEAKEFSLFSYLCLPIPLFCPHLASAAPSFHTEAETANPMLRRHTEWRCLKRCHWWWSSRWKRWNQFREV